MKEVSLSNEEFHEVRQLIKRTLMKRAQSTSRHFCSNHDRVYTERSIRDYGIMLPDDKSPPMTKIRFFGKGRLQRTDLEPAQTSVLVRPD